MIGVQAVHQAGCVCPMKKFLQFPFKAYYTGRVYGKQYSQCVDIIHIGLIYDRIKRANGIMVERIYKSDLSTDERVLMAIVRAAEVFKRNHSAVFRNYGLSFPQYNVLRVLEASSNGQNKMSDVSRIMLVPGANITGLAKGLVKDGFIIKKSDDRDERVTILEITPKGKRTLKNIKREKDKRLELMLNTLSENQKLDLVDKVRSVLKNGMYKSSTT